MRLRNSSSSLNRFDATQGRSTGVQVNAVTKSGTNQLTGLFRGNFRDSMFNSPNRAIGQVRTDSQPADAHGRSAARSLRDKLHFFANYEYEREPRVSIWRTHAALFNVSLEGHEQPEDRRRRAWTINSRHQMRVMGKSVRGRLWEPSGRALRHQSPGVHEIRPEEYNDEILGQFTRC